MEESFLSEPVIYIYDERKRISSRFFFFHVVRNGIWNVVANYLTGITMGGSKGKSWDGLIPNTMYENSKMIIKFLSKKVLFYEPAIGV